MPGRAKCTHCQSIHGQDRAVLEMVYLSMSDGVYSAHLPGFGPLTLLLLLICSVLSLGKGSPACSEKRMCRKSASQSGGVRERGSA